MEKFRKKPVVIEALQWVGTNLREIINFTDGKLDTRTMHAGMKWEEYEDIVKIDGLKIFTPEGKMNADIGDYIIKGVKGEFYPCKPDIFAATYEPESHPTRTYEDGVRDALAQIVDLPTPMTEDCMMGHEEAYRAIETLIQGEKL